jgi:hypothetical protein
MKIELKNIKINLTFSEETTMFMADLVINGIVVGEANNDGRGGCTFYDAKSYNVKKQEFLPDAERKRNRELIQQAEAFCKSQPKQVVDFGGTKHEFDVRLESVIDDLVTAELEKKEQKKLEKKMVDAILWGRPNGHSYTLVKFKMPLSKIPLMQLQGVVNKYKTQLKEGEQFLNTNLEELGIKL